MKSISWRVSHYYNSYPHFNWVCFDLCLFLGIISMADPHVQTLESSTQIPLLDLDETHEEAEDTLLDGSLRSLELFLSFLGFNQSSILNFILSWAAFLVLGVLVPVLILEITYCSDCEKYQITPFELNIVASQACLSAICLLCLAHNLRKYGIRKFLFVDQFNGQMVRFGDKYIQKIWVSFRLLVFWMLPCLILKIIREVVRVLYVPQDAPWQSVAMLVALVTSWTYVNTIYLSACSLFHVVCNLQVLHFEDFGKLLERESDVLVFIEEHTRLRHYLSKISHRFRIFLLLQFFVVTASLTVTLFVTTGYTGTITFVNGGDFAVSSIVQVVGIIICLHAAAKISHKAQALASLASRWHAIVTCSYNDPSQLRISSSMGNLEAASAPPMSSFHINYSESDLESLDYSATSVNIQLASHMSSYHKRQSFVLKWYIWGTHLLEGVTLADISRRLERLCQIRMGESYTRRREGLATTWSTEG